MDAEQTNNEHNPFNSEDTKIKETICEKNNKRELSRRRNANCCVLTASHRTSPQSERIRKEYERNDNKENEITGAQGQNQEDISFRVFRLVLALPLVSPERTPVQFHPQVNRAESYVGLNPANRVKLVLVRFNSSPG